MATPTMTQVTGLLNLIHKTGVSEERLDELLRNGLLEDFFRFRVKIDRNQLCNFLRVGDLRPDLMELGEIILPSINRTFAERTTSRAFGDYYMELKKINRERFPLTIPEGPRKLVLANFGGPVTKENVIESAEANNCELGKIDDLIGIGNVPSLISLVGSNCHILALGSPVQCLRLEFPFWDSGPWGTCLNTYPDIEFVHTFRFLFVRK